MIPLLYFVRLSMFYLTNSFVASNLSNHLSSKIV